MRWTWGMAAALLFAHASARAQPAPASLPRLFLLAADLQVDLGPGTERCPRPAYLRRLVADEMAYDPFAPDAKGSPVGRFAVRVVRVPSGLRAVTAYVDTAGTTRWTRTYEDVTTTRPACESVMKGVALQIDAELTRLDDAPAPSPPSAPVCSASSGASTPPPCIDSRFSVWPTEWPLPPLRPPTPDPPKPRDRWPFAVRIGISAWPELIVSGLGSFGVSAEVGVRYRAVSFGVEAHGDPPIGSVVFAGFGSVSFGRMSAALLACGHYAWFVGCAVGDVGRFLFPDPVRNLPPSTHYDAAGVRVGLEFPVAPPRFFLRTTFDMRAPIDPATYSAAHVTAFAPVGLSVGLGLGVLVELPP